MEYSLKKMKMLLLNVHNKFVNNMFGHFSDAK